MVSIYDPLYETINFEKEISTTDPFMIMGQIDRSKLFKELLNSYEMSRLIFLKQAGLNFLQFPSATYNRFSHSIGCWKLGIYSLEDIQVQIDENEYWSLGKWFKDGPIGGMYEYLISLLLHDIGHGPFSHVIENNGNISFNHEDVTYQLIMGEGDYYNIFKEHAKNSRMKCVHEILSNSKYNLKIDLIGKFIKGFDSNDKHEELKLIRELVDGKIDLDRLDHYARDSMYMGIKLAAFNVRAFLENIVINPEMKSILMRDEGVPHIQNILHSRGLIWMTALSHENVRSYEVMLNKAISRYLINNDQKEIVFEDDCGLIKKLLKTDDDVIKDLVNKILSRNNYSQIYKFKVNHDDTRQMIENKLKEIITKNRLEDHQILVHVPYKTKPKRSDTWFKFKNMNGIDINRINPLFENLIQNQADHETYIKFFSNIEDEKTKKSVINDLQIKFPNYY